MIQEQLKAAGFKNPGECCEILVVVIFLVAVSTIATIVIWLVFLCIYKSRPNTFWFAHYWLAKRRVATGLCQRSRGQHKDAFEALVEKEIARIQTRPSVFDWSCMNISSQKLQ